MSAANLVVTLVGCSPFGEGSVREATFFPMAPQITRLSQSGALGVASTTLYGDGFAEDSQVKIGGLPCASFTYVSATEVRCTTSASLGVGLWDVTVTNGFNQVGTLTHGFANLVASPALWLRADAPSPLADGASVSQWSDMSGNSRHATQVTTTLMPLYKTDVINAKPVIRFGGTYPDAGNNNPFLVISAPQSTVFKFGAMADFSVVVVTRSTTTGYYHQFIANESANNRVGLGMAIVGDPAAGSLVGLPFFHARNGCCPAAFGTQAANDNAWRVFTGVRTGDTTDFYVNAVRQGGVTSGAGVSLAAAQDLYIGRDPNNYFPWGGDIAEVLIYPVALSTSERAIVEGHLLQKYGL